MTAINTSNRRQMYRSLRRAIAARNEAKPGRRGRPLGVDRETAAAVAALAPRGSSFDWDVPGVSEGAARSFAEADRLCRALCEEKSVPGYVLLSMPNGIQVQAW